MVKRLEAKFREETGGGACRRYREQDLIPAVVYGRDIESQNLVVEGEQIRDLLRDGAMNNVLIELDVDKEDGERQVLIKDADIHPVSSDLLHVDLHQVSAGDRVQVKVPIELTGTSVGVEQDNGILDKPAREITVDCPVEEIPETIELPIDDLEIGDNLFVSDLEVKEDIQVLTEANRVLVSVQPPEEYDLDTTPATGVDVIEETVEEALEEAEEVEEAEEEAEEGEQEAAEATEEAT